MEGIKSQRARGFEHGLLIIAAVMAAVIVAVSATFLVRALTRTNDAGSSAPATQQVAPLPGSGADAKSGYGVAPLLGSGADAKSGYGVGASAPVAPSVGAAPLHSR